MFGVLLIFYLLTEIFAMSSPDKLQYLKDTHITYIQNFHILEFFFNLLKNSGLSLALFKEKFYPRLFKVGEKFVDTIFCDSELYL